MILSNGLLLHLTSLGVKLPRVVAGPGISTYEAVAEVLPAERDWKKSA